MSWFAETPEGVIVNVRAQPRSSRSGVDSLLGDALKVRIHSAPVEGKANKEIIEVLSEYFSIPKSHIAFKGGETSKTKRLLLKNVKGTDMKKLMTSIAAALFGFAAFAGGWCYKVGEYEAWRLKQTVEESYSALCKVGWPGKFEYPTVEPKCFYRETPAEGYDFIPGDRNVPPHRAVRPTHEVAVTEKKGFYDLRREEIGYVQCEAHERPRLFVGESVAEVWNNDWNGFEQVTVMERTGDGRWRSKYPLALRYFRFDSKVKNIRFFSEVDRSEPKIAYRAPNRRAAGIWRAAVDSLRLSTRTFLLDGPKRDRLPWMGDFVVSCLANAYSFADPEPCRRSLVAVGTPARLGHVNGIGAYSLWWVVGHDLVQRKFPDERFLALHYPRIKERVEALDECVDERGYYAKNLGWNFLDWTDSKGGQLKSETTLQVVYFAALKSAANLARAMKDGASAAKWDKKAEALRAKILAAGMDGTRHSRALAIVFDLVTGETAKRYAAEIAADDLPPTVTPYMATMEVWALAKAGETDAAKRKFESVWGAMYDLGADTFWEGFDPAQKENDRYEYYARPFGKSLCHAWSSGPAFLLPMFPALAAEPTKPLRVLMIGNSFSISNTRYMPQICKSMGLDLELGSLYIGGCSLERHWNNVVASTNAAFRPYGYGFFRNGERVNGKSGSRNIPEVLADADWDVVTLQQASHFSWKADSYHPFGDGLVAKIRELCPKAEIVVQETWSYTPWDKRLANWKIDQNQMYSSLRDAYAGFAAKYGFRVIPMGTAVQEWRRRLPVRYAENSFGGDVCGSAKFVEKDGKYVPKGDVFHLNRRGEYFQSLVWTAKLFGADMTKCEWRPNEVSEADARLMREIATELARKGK